MDERPGKLEDLNTALKNRVMIFYNINEIKDENLTDIVHSILEDQLGFVNAKDTVMMDPCAQIGKTKSSFIYNQTTSHYTTSHFFPDKERILAKKLKGRRIAISEQFPEEIMQVRKHLYPVLKKARQEHKRVKMVRDKLYIEGQLCVESKSLSVHIFNLSNIQSLYIYSNIRH